MAPDAAVEPICTQCLGLKAKADLAHGEAVYWRVMHGRAVEREKQLAVEVEELKAKLRQRERQLFGRRSECTKGKTEGQQAQDRQISLPAASWPIRSRSGPGAKWRRPDGRLKDMSCRVAMLRMQADGLLALTTRRIADHWQQRYGYRPVLVETFVEVPRFHATCYRAANWIGLGETQGRGKRYIHHEALLPRKSVLVYPLAKNFRTLLCAP